MDHSKTFVLIVGNNTNKITKGDCQYCESYNSHTYACARGYSIDYHSYIKYECEKAIEADIKIIVLYKDIVVDKDKCPEIIRYYGVHVPMIYFENGKYYWDYNSVKEAFYN